jgi:hypothetical protein
MNKTGRDGPGRLGINVTPNGREEEMNSRKNLHSGDPGMLRVRTRFDKRIGADPAAVFPLLCPVEEYKWIPAWDCRMVYSRSGTNELDGLFFEELSGPMLLERPATSLWVTSRYEPQNGRVDFVVNCGGHALIRFAIAVAGIDGGARVRWDAVYTALDETGGQAGVAAVKARLNQVVSALADFLKHYCETGSIMA